jgi:hypothetical protein
VAGAPLSAITQVNIYQAIMCHSPEDSFIFMAHALRSSTLKITLKKKQITQKKYITSNADQFTEMPFMQAQNVFLHFLVMATSRVLNLQ